MSATKNIIICADDYALNDAVSNAILELAINNKISATSCMTNMPTWQQHSQSLKTLPIKIDIGLHFNLTEGKPLVKEHNTLNNDTFFSQKKLIRKAYCRTLNKANIKAELTAQIEQFSKQMGHLPDFIDGHQHIQQLPIIRDAIIEVYHELNLRQHHTYLRVSTNGWWLSLQQPQKFKALILTILGGNTFRKLLLINNIPHNSSFSGIYDFSPNADYAMYFAKFLSQLQNNGILMCHPGLQNNDNSDPIAAARSNEYQFFNNNAFTKICTQKNIYAGRFLS